MIEFFHKFMNDVDFFGKTITGIMAVAITIWGLYAVIKE